MIKYVRATLRDLPKIEALETACFTADAFSHRQLRNLVISQSAIVLLAVACGERNESNPPEADDVIGSAIGMITKRGISITGRLYSLCVREDYRRRNIATELLSWLEGIFFTRGVKRITLEVRENNLPARRFYEKHGFLEKNIITNYYQDRINAVKMEKCLKYSLEEAILA